MSSSQSSDGIISTLDNNTSPNNSGVISQSQGLSASNCQQQRPVNSVTGSYPSIAGNFPSSGGVGRDPPKELNVATVCRIGQETVQEIVGRLYEIVSVLKSIQPPVSASEKDRVMTREEQRLNELLKGVSQHFKRLHMCWEKTEDYLNTKCNFSSISTSSLDLKNHLNLQNLIPLKDDSPSGGGLHDESNSQNDLIRDIRAARRKDESYQQTLEEHSELRKELREKNQHILKVMQEMRSIVWEINVMTR